MILLDTNIIVYSKQPDSEFHAPVTERLTQLADEGNDLVICPQVIYEFYRVATSPAQNNRGLGLTSAEALGEIENLLETYDLLSENDTLQHWKGIMTQYNVIGLRSYDARLVATMQANNIQMLYTINSNDFNQFNALIVLL